MKPRITFAVVPDPIRADCLPVAVLNVMADEGLLTRFQNLWGEQTGDCHEIAGALYADIISAGVPGDWQWYVGRCPNIGDHSWIECDGWAIDAANGSTTRPVVVMPSRDYRKDKSNIALAMQGGGKRIGEAKATTI